MGELASTLDALGALAADDLFSYCDAELLDRSRELVRARNMLDAELARVIRRAELAQAAEHDGLKSMKSWLRTHCRQSGSAITGLVKAGRVQEHLPAVAAACTAGLITADQVEVLAEITTPEALAKAAAAEVDLAAIEAAFVAVAVDAPHRDLQKAVGAYLAALDPDGPEPDPTEGRSLSMVAHPDGSFTGGFSLDPVGGEKVAAALESIAAAGRCAGDTRTRAQRLGDALVQLADLHLASGNLPVLRTVKPHVGVLIGIEDLVDPGAGQGAATTSMGAAISAARARMLACDGNVTRIVLGPDSVPMEMGRSHRVVPPHLRRAVELRDTTCVFAGCEAPAWWCDVHHLLHWGDGGETSLENSALLCERHSHLVSITGSGSNEIPRADGTPTGPTAARSSSAKHCCSDIEHVPADERPALSAERLLLPGLSRLGSRARPRRRPPRSARGRAGPAWSGRWTRATSRSRAR